MDRKKAASTPATNLGLEKKLAAYVSAATAAGIALFGATTAANARIVATKANQVVGFGATPIDLNHDGTNDFTIQLAGFGAFCPLNHGVCLGLEFDVAGNQVIGVGADASALQRGVAIGPKQAFTSKTSYGLAVMAGAGMYTQTYSFGPWKQATNRFLGLKFLIDGKVHYGWARLTVPAQFERSNNEIMLTGYAYETIPNMGIRAGAIHGGDAAEANGAPDASEAVGGAGGPSLGALALGADGLSASRPQEPASGY